MNILTFDIEEWFHLLDNDSTRSEEQWKGFEVRIYENMERIFVSWRRLIRRLLFRDRLDRQDISGYREADRIQVSGGKPYDESSVSVATIEGGIQRGCLFFHKIAGGYNGTEGRGFSCAGLLDP